MKQRRGNTHLGPLSLNVILKQQHGGKANVRIDGSRLDEFKDDEGKSLLSLQAVKIGFRYASSEPTLLWAHLVCACRGAAFAADTGRAPACWRR